MNIIDDIPAPPWYSRLDEWLQPQFPLMLFIAFAIIGVTLFLLWRGDRVLLAGWLVYLLSP